jgi:hypothetical protein
LHETITPSASGIATHVFAADVAKSSGRITSARLVEALSPAEAMKWSIDGLPP